jgi:hypothetical protein
VQVRLSKSHHDAASQFIMAACEPTSMELKLFGLWVIGLQPGSDVLLIVRVELALDQLFG